MSNTEILHIWTTDNLRLQGIHYDSSKKDLCVLFIHGMSGNFIENYFTSVLGKVLQEANIGFIYAHNRGYNHINDIAIKNTNQNGGYGTVRIGVTYEKFSDCVYDIDGWIKECERLGYKKIILLGHSLGCNKVIHYCSQNKSQDVVGIILASPPDIVGLFKKPEYQKNYTELLEEAAENIKNSEPRKILSSMIWNYYNLSSQTFLDLAVDNCLADNLPILRNPEKFEELASINVPILGIMGEYDDIAINDLKEDLEMIKNKATNCPQFSIEFIPKANHVYDKREEYFSGVVSDWILGLGK
jgi:pimeloyl-ACP methyl ester carboxylesterase